MKVVVVSHCDFSGNSAFHALAVSRELHARGHSPAILLPANKETVEYVGEPPFPVLTYDEARKSLPFAPDLVHAFTPREHVRLVTEDLAAGHGCPYVVHLEDNEEVILADDLALQSADGATSVPVAALDTLPGTTSRSHPVRALRFLDRAAGLTAVIDTLLEFKPDHVPGAVFWPGFEAAMLEDRPRGRLREELGLAEDDLALVYTGNIHNSNLAEVRSLYIAVGLLRRAGLPVRLVKAGWNHVDMAWADEVVDPDGVIELGFVGRERVTDLLAVADVLVQPGGANPFNDYRFPSKLPEFLASGKPVVLPETNVGHHLADGDEALLLRRGDATEIFHAVRRLAEDPELRARLGANGRRFAVERLSWNRNVDAIVDLYERVTNGGAAAAARPRIAREHDAWTAPPAKLVAFHTPDLADDPDALERDAPLARSHGIYGFCLRYDWPGGELLDRLLEGGGPAVPFCLCWANESANPNWPAYQTRAVVQAFAPGWEERFLLELLPALANPCYMRVGEAPLLLVAKATLVPEINRVVERWRELALAGAGLTLHVAALQSLGLDDPRPYGLDAAVEFPPHNKAFLVDEEVERGEPGFRGYSEDAGRVMARQLTAPLPGYRWYRGAMPAWDSRGRRAAGGHVVVDSSPELFRTWFRKLVLQTACRSAVDEPLIFLNGWSEWAECVDDGHPWLEATRAALVDGLRQYYASLGYELGEEQVAAYLRDVLPPPSPREERPAAEAELPQTLTSAWFDTEELESIAERYAAFQAPPLGYATVRDYADSREHLRPLAIAAGDLKDVQRPWVLKAILGSVPRGGRVLEIGAGQPYVGDLLARLGYEVWVVDPYDGSGNGPVEFEYYRGACPGVRFVRDLFSDRLDELEPGAFDCVYSISVIEHVHEEGIAAVVRGIRKALKPSGVTIHAVDHIQRGEGHEDNLGKLRRLVEGLQPGQPDEPDATIERLAADAETYVASAETHERWRGELPYEDFPMRVVVSIHIAAPA